MNGYDLDSIARRVIERAARRAPPTLAERLQEEWLADLSDHHGRIERLKLALGCYWAAFMITDDDCTASTPVLTSTGATGMTLAALPHGVALFPQQAANSERGSAICEINTTPLIDVLLVLLVTMIITLPMMTQAVRVDLPRSSRDTLQPEVINLDIDFDGTVVWNGSPISNLDQLEGYFRTESRRVPQPEIHLRPDAYVKYDVVAKVLAAAQRNQLKNVGFVNDAEFAN
jgi:biopolymer transport protein ExbD